MMAVLSMIFVSIATGLIVSGVWLSAVWYRCRRPGESWDDARKREMAHLDRLAEQDDARVHGRLVNAIMRDARNAELAEIPDTVRSLDRSVN